MRYSFDITIPKNTLITDPYEQSIRLDTGLLTNISIGFKAGCHNLVNVAVFDALEQIAPANGSLSIYGDADMISIPMQHEIGLKPYSLIVRCWSDGTRYSHVITFWFDVIETAKKEESGLIQQFKHLLNGEL